MRWPVLRALQAAQALKLHRLNKIGLCFTLFKLRISSYHSIFCACSQYAIVYVHRTNFTFAMRKCCAWKKVTHICSKREKTDRLFMCKRLYLYMVVRFFSVCVCTCGCVRTCVRARAFVRGLLYVLYFPVFSFFNNIELFAHDLNCLNIH